jgi:hypothetical protein
MPSSLVVLDSEWRTSDATTSTCLKRNCTNRSSVKLWRWKVPRTSTTLLKIKSSAVSAGATRTMRPTHWLSHASAEDLWVLSISSASSLGFSLKSKRSHQVLRTKTSGVSTGRDSSAKSASKCTHTLSRSDLLSTRLLIRLMKLRRKLLVTTFFLNPCLWIRILRGISICWRWLLSRPNLNLDVDMSPKFESMILVSVDATLSSSASKMVSILKTTPLSSVPSSFWKISSDWRPTTPWLCKWAGPSSVSPSSTYNQKRRNWSRTSPRFWTQRTRQWDLWRVSHRLRVKQWLLLSTTRTLHYTCSRLSTLSRSTCQWRTVKTVTSLTKEMLCSTIMITTKTTIESV